MKKQFSLLGSSFAILGVSLVALMASAGAATNSGYYGASVADLSSGPNTKSSARASEYKKYETRTSTATYKVNPKPVATTTYTTTARPANLYYVQPETRVAAEPQLTRYYAANEAKGPATAVTQKKVIERKYYLAHPFFQPHKGQFGSITDLAYTNSSYKFDIYDGDWAGLSGDWSAKQTSIKEDLSYGITDTVAVIGSARYSNSKYEFNWNPPIVAPDNKDSMKDSGIDVAGLGMQWRFYDDAEWIAYFGAYYQWWKDLANVIALDAKAGYKINTNATVYGLARVFYFMWDENSYGNGISDNGKNLYLTYEENVDSSIYFEGGIGFFSVLAEDFTLNAELVFGDYGWHNQGSIKAAFGWQPGKAFALNLYGKMAIYDSADDAKGLHMYAWQDNGPVFFEGNTALSDYSEWTVGLQVMFTF